jgi:alpha-glucosidase (family GH31 glycosyl hydrolase)
LSRLLLALALSGAACAQTIAVQAGGTKLIIERQPMRIAVEHDGVSTVGAHPDGGLLLGNPDHPEPVSIVSESFSNNGQRAFTVRTPSGKSARITLTVTANQIDFVVEPSEPEAALMRFAPVSPGFGLGDHAVVGRPSFDTELTGYTNDHFLSGQGLSRMVSNFVIYPKQKFAFLVWEPQAKIVRSTEHECTQGSRRVEGSVRFSIFVGTPKEIYRQFLESRNLFGYPVMKPKYEFFGVGWEAFGALAWDTDQKTVTENVDRYLAEGYPLKWMVVGSGFWPSAEDRMHETTSFGLYDPKRYPNPAAFIAHFHSEGLKYLQGLRTTFITDGPFAAEGLKNNVFVEEAGNAKVMQFGWPKSPIYFLDWHKAEAVNWFVDLVHRWTAYGVDGYKEDVYGFGKYGLGDDKLDPINEALMREGQYIMGRNAYLASPADLHRVNDFNYNQNQDRGPVNALALAYSGFPLIYPDIVGGTFGEGHFDLKVTPRMKTYMMRNAQWASLHSSMGMGQGPWTFGDPQVEKVMLAAARLHDRLQPYLYSQAIRFYLEGYPWTMAPLPVAFPDDEGTYGRENDRVRGYEWMIGDSLLATPLYGNDYESAAARDVYLPSGVWIDYDTGKKYRGPATLHQFALPPGKTPLFVGGPGIVVEKRDTGLVARIFPVEGKAHSIFIYPDGLAKSSIEKNVVDWKRISVTVKNGGLRKGEWKQGAFEFAIAPGENYEVH